MSIPILGYQYVFGLGGIRYGYKVWMLRDRITVGGY